jgi:predicted nuclease of predicted toxin-antitoxin system
MRFLADEGVDAAIVSALRSDGHDIQWMAEELEGSTDDVVLDAAARDARILITEDKDFGELVFRQRLHHRGVQCRLATYMPLAQFEESQQDLQ